MYISFVAGAHLSGRDAAGTEIGLVARSVQLEHLIVGMALEAASRRWMVKAGIRKVEGGQ